MEKTHKTKKKYFVGSTFGSHEHLTPGHLSLVQTNNGNSTNKKY